MFADYPRRFCIQFDVPMIIVEDNSNVVLHQQDDVQPNYKHSIVLRMKEMRGFLPNMTSVFISIDFI